MRAQESLEDILATHAKIPTRDRLSDLAHAESRHRYTDPRTGERVTSVTAIVGSFDSGDKLGAGAGAAIKLRNEGQDYRKVWGSKRDIGSRVHEYAELWINGKTAEVSEEDMPWMDSFAAWCDAKQPEWLVTERAVVSSLGYGGRFDAIVYFEGEYWLIDFKTGKPYKFELMLQLVGYLHADGMIVYDKTGKAVDLEPMPHIDRCAGLYLTDKGFNFMPVDITEEDWECFKALLRVKNRSREVGRKKR